ncbi:methyltransferase domain-containing protein [Candidatus Pelagibacter communis]|uniref:methyltransferase domain-containing protein n=1 Tax=Pelagibacter ubique TaxID=198252 RepID=UPI00094D63CE|nr:methyltransferase domain-containing protein [Candidatus Pelagibacter ubique]
MADLKIKNFTIANNYSKKYSNIFLNNVTLKKSKNSSLLYLKNNFDLCKFKENNKIIKYSEPEEHISFISKLILKKIKSKKIKAIGISIKDETLLKKIREKNKNTQFKVFSRRASLEKTIYFFTKKKFNEKYNIVILRHIWEHIYDQKKFFLKLKEIIQNDHLIYIEVPDCLKLIKNLDYSMIWEEHRYYYTKHTLIGELRNLGFEIVLFKRIPHPQEDNLCLLLKIKKKKVLKIKKNRILENLSLSYLKNLSKQKIKNKAFFENLKKNNFKLVFYGATHMLNTFLNINKIKEADYLIDDDIKKRNKFFSVIKKPIINFNNFMKIDDNKLAIFISCNLALENKILSKLKKLKKRPKIYSIFPHSKNYFLNIKGS